MRSTKTTLALAMAAGGAALLASRGDVAASGTIDTSGATITIGDAPVQGSTVVDSAASLGIKPRLDPPSSGWSFTLPSPDGYPWEYGGFLHAGLGGSTFRAQVDLTYPGGTYDYGSFTVDQGVTVRFTGPATLRATNAMRIEGRVVMEGAGVLTLDCAGDVTIVGHDDAVTTGLFADDDDASILVAAGGAVDVSADAGAKAHFHATGARGAVTVYSEKKPSADEALTTSIADADFAAAEDGRLLVRFDGGKLELTNCVMTGPVAAVYAPVSTGDWAYLDEATQTWNDTLVVSGGTYAGVSFFTNFGLRITGGASIAGGDTAAVRAFQGPLRIEGTSSIRAEQTVQVMGTSVTIGDGCELRATGSTPGNYLPSVMVVANGNDPLGISVAPGAVIEDHVGAGLGIYANGAGIDVQGTVRGLGQTVELFAGGGDVAIEDGADLDTPNGSIHLWAQGAVTAAGGTATLSAREYDVRCVTGDLDLDVATMDATAGRIVAMSNGTVRLRGTYRATGDVQVISLADSIDVAGATLSTNDATTAPSGFVRMATYAATKIDAGNSTLTTGDSETQSGDVIVQVEDGGSAVSSAAMRVSRVTARRTPDGVLTRIQGTISSRALRTTEFSGSARVTAGELSKRIFLQGLTGRIEGTSGTVTVKLTRVGKTHVRFVIEIREPSATAGERKSLRFARAGFHAEGRFKRPKAR
jgi:hypothetical protein